MRKFYELMLTAKGDPTLQVIDLILFLGYFSVCLYGGGVAYESSYNDAFHLQVKPNVGDPRVAIGFVTNVLLVHWYWIPSSLYILLFIFVFYASRYVWRPWFGYFLLSLLLYFTFLMCGLMGKTIGSTDASKDKLQSTTSKPDIKLYGKYDDQNFSSGNFRLLYEVDKWFFVFEPQGVPGSVIQVHAIPKSKVERYEVIIK
jgi:hypothetical protein